MSIGGEKSDCKESLQFLPNSLANSSKTINNLNYKKNEKRILKKECINETWQQFRKDYSKKFFHEYKSYNHEKVFS